MQIPSFLVRLQHAGTHIGPVAPTPPSFMVPAINRGSLGFLVNKGERAITALGLGFLKGAYREKTLIAGRIPLEMVVGLGFTGLAAFFKIRSQGESVFAPHIEAVGDTAMATWLHGIGTVWGARHTGREVLILNAGAARPAVAPAGFTEASYAIGDIPPAAPGTRFLSAEQIANWTAPRVAA